MKLLVLINKMGMVKIHAGEFWLWRPAICVDCTTPFILICVQRGGGGKLKKVFVKIHASNRTHVYVPHPAYKPRGLLPAPSSNVFIT